MASASEVLAGLIGDRSPSGPVRMTEFGLITVTRDLLPGVNSQFGMTLSVANWVRLFGNDPDKATTPVGKKVLAFIVANAAEIKRRQALDKEAIVKERAAKEKAKGDAKSVLADLEGSSALSEAGMTA